MREGLRCESQAWHKRSKESPFNKFWTSPATALFGLPMFCKSSLVVRHEPYISQIKYEIDWIFSPTVARENFRIFQRCRASQRFLLLTSWWNCFYIELLKSNWRRWNAVKSSLLISRNYGHFLKIDIVIGFLAISHQKPYKFWWKWYQFIDLWFSG
jgi:hypothetical protein